VAARKKSARKSAPVKLSDERPALKPDPDDPRPEAWRKILEARGRREPVSRELRVHIDQRFVGDLRVAQVHALMTIGIEVEEAAAKILEAAMIEHRGEKHCIW